MTAWTTAVGDSWNRGAAKEVLIGPENKNICPIRMVMMMRWNLRKMFAL
jgi:hypothetical protein